MVMHDVILAICKASESSKMHFGMMLDTVDIHNTNFTLIVSLVGK